VTFEDRNRTAELMNCLGVVSVDEMVSSERLKSFGHVERIDKSNWVPYQHAYPKSDWVSTLKKSQVEGTKSKGRGRKTWNECVKVDMN